MLHNAFSVTSMAAYPQLPYELAREARDGELHHTRPTRATDIVTISDNPTLALYLSGLFHESGWSIARTRTCAGGIDFLQNNRAAVVVCEEELPDGTWREAAAALAGLPEPPALIVVGGDDGLPQQVAACGGFDALVRPLREADVVWTIASAWHVWMKKFEAAGDGGPPCSGV